MDYYRLNKTDKPNKGESLPEIYKYFKDYEVDYAYLVDGISGNLNPNFSQGFVGIKKFPDTIHLRFRKGKDKDNFVDWDFLPDLSEITNSLFPKMRFIEIYPPTNIIVNEGPTKHLWSVPNFFYENLFQTIAQSKHSITEFDEIKLYTFKDLNVLFITDKNKSGNWNWESLEKQKTKFFGENSTCYSLLLRDPTDSYVIIEQPNINLPNLKKFYPNEYQK